MKKFILFLILVFLSLMFLFFQSGNWLYLDNSGIANTFARDIEYFYGSLSTISFDTYFGFDNTLLHSARFLQGFFNLLGQRIVYILFFVFSFLSSYFLLKEKFSKENSFWGALVYTFNPISFYFISQIGFVFVYFSLPLIILSIYKYFSEGKCKYLLLSVFGFYFLLFYTRLIGLYGFFLVFIGIYHYKFIKDVFLNKKKLFLVFMLTHILLFLPFLFSFVYLYFSGDKEYFSGLGNYSSSSISFGEGLYNGVLNENFYNGFLVSEVTWNAVRSFQSSNIFIIYSILFIVGLAFYTLFINRKEKDKFILFLICLFLFLIFTRFLAKFIPVGLFVPIVYKYFPFVANNLGWFYVLYIPIIVYLFTFCLQYTMGTKLKNTLVLAGFVYLSISIYPFANFWGNYKLQTIDIKNIPQNYQNTFFADKIDRKASVFIPGGGLYMNWTPYVLEFGNNSIYKHIFTNNNRLVNAKQAELFNSPMNLQNNAIFNVKDIFVFKDVRNPKAGQFDFYELNDYVGKLEWYYEFLKNNKYFYLKQDNKNFAQFGIKGDSQYDFLLYSPSEIIEAEIPELLYKNLDYKLNPILIDKESFHKTKKIDDFYIPRENKKVQISYKKSVLQPTKIYTKIQNIGSKKGFLIQLNQTFGMSWKIKWITKEEFEERNCINNNRNFVFTNNSFCEYKASILDLSDLKYLFRKGVKEQNHFEGNFVGNAWLVEEDDISSESKDKKELYAVIIYEKQIWYSIALVISWFTFTCLLLLTAYQELKNIFKKKGGKKV